MVEVQVLSGTYYRLQEGEGESRLAQLTANRTQQQRTSEHTAAITRAFSNGRIKGWDMWARLHETLRRSVEPHLTSQAAEPARQFRPYQLQAMGKQCH